MIFTPANRAGCCHVCCHPACCLAALPCPAPADVSDLLGRWVPVHARGHGTSQTMPGSLAVLLQDAVTITAHAVMHRAESYAAGTALPAQLSGTVDLLAALLSTPAAQALLGAQGGHAAAAAAGLEQADLLGVILPMQHVAHELCTYSSILSSQPAPSRQARRAVEALQACCSGLEARVRQLALRAEVASAASGQRAEAAGLAFQWMESPLVHAMRQGHWVGGWAGRENYS